MPCLRDVNRKFNLIFMTKSSRQGWSGCKVAEDMGRRVLTHPTYYGLTAADATTIAEMIKELVI